MKRRRSQRALENGEKSNNPSTCNHEEVFENMCCLCGKLIVSKNGYRVRDATINDLDKGSGHFIRQRSKQAVIFDIDNTILVAHPGYLIVRGAGDIEQWDAHGMSVLWRPGIIDGMKTLCQNGTDLYIQTKGTRAYANQVKQRLNEKAGRALIRDENVISRDEERGLYKSLAHFFSDKDPHVVVVDDRTDVWKDDALYVIQITAWEWPNAEERENAQILASRFEEDAIEVEHVFTTLRDIFSSSDTPFIDTLRRVIHHREQEAGPDEERDGEILKALSKSVEVQDDS